MNFTGFLCEYNPFHKGHQRHLDFSRQSGQPCVCVMSGPFVQRGEPALCDPWTRAKAALDMGCDAVILLPAFYCLQPAEFFARSAMTLLTRLGAGCVTFGSPVTDETLLRTLGTILNDPVTHAALRQGLDQGLSYPAALEQAARTGFGAQSEMIHRILGSANAMLGVEYLRSLCLAGYGGEIRIVERSAQSISATALRARLREDHAQDWLDSEQAQDCLPEAMRRALQTRRRFADPEILGVLFAYLCRTQPDFLLPDDAEGIASRLKKAAAGHTSREDILCAAKTRRYTRSRLARSMLHALLHITPTLCEELRREMPLYVYPLALNARGTQCLSQWKKDGLVPVIDRPAAFVPQSPALKALWRIEQDAMELYRLLDPCLAPGSLFTHPVIRQP